jgi:hypothetical protein
MVAHYVEKHEYLPPPEFIDAVLAAPAPGTEDYRRAVGPFIAPGANGSLEQFGPFAHAFTRNARSVPGHLELLGLQGRAAQVVIDRIERALARDGAFRFVDVLFDDPNWRPHLVGAVALILDDGDHTLVRALWRAIDAGSWVIPQLVVTALMIDRDFPARLVERVEASCSAKLLASLLSVGAAVQSLGSWIAGAREEPRVVDLLKQDVDNAPSIAEGWQKRLVEHFALRGRVLKPKAA